MHLLNYLNQQIKSIDCDIKLLSIGLKFVFYLHLSHSEKYRLVAVVSYTEENVRKINESFICFQTTAVKIKFVTIQLSNRLASK